MSTSNPSDHHRYAGQPGQPSRGGAVLIGSILLGSVGGGLFLPLSIVYFTALTDVPLALLGTLLSASAAVTIPIPLWAGALADRIGPRPLVIGSQLLTAVAYLAYGSVTEPLGIFLASAVGAVGGRFFWSSIFTLIADYADHATVSRKEVWFAWANIVRTVGLGVGGLLTGLVIADGRDAAYRAVAHASCACYAVATAALTAFLRVPRRHRAPGGPALGYRTLFGDHAFLGFTALNSCYALSTVMLGLALPTFVRTALHGPAWLTSTILVGNAVLIALLGSPLTRQLAPWRRTRVLCVAAGLWTAWCLVCAAVAGGHGHGALVALAGATFLFTLAEVMHAPASMAIAAATAPMQARGRYLAVFQYSFVAAEIGAPVFFTSLFEIAYALPFLVLAGINLVGLAGTVWLERRLPAQAMREPTPSAAPA